MGKIMQLLFSAGGAIFAVTFFLSGLAGIFYVSGTEMPGNVEFFLYALMFLCAGFWLQRDVRKSKFHDIADIGFLLYLTWPILLPYYLIRTRKFNGLLIVLAYMAAYFLPFWSVVFLFRLFAVDLG